jgi:excisionase family DNA binding protein
MNISEVAAYIKLAKANVYNLTHRNTIPHYKNGKRLYFKKEKIEKWIFYNKIKTSEDIKKETLEYLCKNSLRS